MIETSRRSLLIGGLTTLFAAPAIVRAASLMPIKAIEARAALPAARWITFDEYVERILKPSVARLRAERSDFHRSLIDTIFDESRSRAERKLAVEISLDRPQPEFVIARPLLFAV